MHPIRNGVFLIQTLSSVQRFCSRMWPVPGFYQPLHGVWYFEDQYTQLALLSSEICTNVQPVYSMWCSAMLCKRPQGVFPLLSGSELWIELLLRRQSSDALSNPTTQNSLSPLEITLDAFHQSKPSIKHAASSLSLFKRIRDVAVWPCLSDTLQSAVRTNNNVYEF